MDKPIILPKLGSSVKSDSGKSDYANWVLSLKTHLIDNQRLKEELGSVHHQVRGKIFFYSTALNTIIQASDCLPPPLDQYLKRKRWRQVLPRDYATIELWRQDMRQNLALELKQMYLMVESAVHVGAAMQEVHPTEINQAVMDLTIRLTAFLLFREIHTWSTTVRDFNELLVRSLSSAEAD